MLETLWHMILMDQQDSQHRDLMLLTQAISHSLLNKEQLSNHLIKKVHKIVVSNLQIHHYALLLLVNHIKIQIYLEPKLAVKLFKNQQLWLSNQNKDKPTLLPDPMLWVMMTQQLKKTMEHCIKQFKGLKAIGKVVFLPSHS